MGLLSFIYGRKLKRKDRLILNTINEMGVGKDTWRCMVTGSYLGEWFPAQIIGQYGVDGLDFFVLIEYPNGTKIQRERTIWQIKDVYKVEI